MILKAYAKVNLILRVTGKLDNGYHSLQMINSKINIYDEIQINKNSKNIDTLTFINSNLTSNDNLVLKALKLFKDTYHIKDTFDIQITKNIPVGAGMGGGSSDVACIINYLKDIYDIDLDTNLFNNLGADIKYFLYKGIKYVEGTGDIIYNKDILTKTTDFVIVYPNINIVTSDVFKLNTKYSQYIDKDKLINEFEKNDYHIYINDLEEATFNLNKELQLLKEELSKMGYTVMTGSGSTMMVFSNNIDDIYDKCINKFKEYYIRKVKIIQE